MMETRVDVLTNHNDDIIMMVRENALLLSSQEDKKEYINRIIKAIHTLEEEIILDLKEYVKLTELVDRLINLISLS